MFSCLELFSEHVCTSCCKEVNSKLCAEGDIVQGEVMVTPCQLLLLSIMQFDTT